MTPPEAALALIVAAGLTIGGVLIVAWWHDR